MRLKQGMTASSFSALEGLLESLLTWESINKPLELWTSALHSSTAPDGCLPNWMQVVREKLYRRIHKELPYRLDIKLTQSDVLKDGSSLFHYTILCPSEAVSCLRFYNICLWATLFFV